MSAEIDRHIQNVSVTPSLANPVLMSNASHGPHPKTAKTTASLPQRLVRRRTVHSEKHKKNQGKPIQLEDTLPSKGRDPSAKSSAHGKEPVSDSQTSEGRATSVKQTDGAQDISQTSSGSHKDDRVAKTLTADEMLKMSEESHYCDVYELNLHGLSLTNVNDLEKFSRLRCLDVSSNFLQDFTTLLCCKDLRELKLYDTGLSELVPLGSLTCLSTLQLQHNQLKTIGKSLAGLNKLKVLRLDCNKLMQLEARDISSCTQLAELDISYNRLEDISSVNSLPNLLELKICNNNLKTIRDLSRCKKLTVLDLSGNRLTSLNGLLNLPSLKVLNVSKNGLKTLKGVETMARLEELDASFNFLPGCAPLVALRSIEIVDLSRNRISEWANVKCLQIVTSLRELSLAGNPVTAETGQKPFYIDNLSRLMPLLQVIDNCHPNTSSPDHESEYIEGQPSSASSVASTPRTMTPRPSSSAGHRPLSGFSVRPPSSMSLSGRPGSASAHMPSALLSRPGTAMSSRPGTSSGRPMSAMSAELAAIAAPLMRPMTATSEISARQVETQLLSIEANLQAFEDLEKSFSEIRATLHSLPLRTAPRASAAGASAAGASAAGASAAGVVAATRPASSGVAPLVNMTSPPPQSLSPRASSSTGGRVLSSRRSRIADAQMFAQNFE